MLYLKILVNWSTFPFSCLGMCDANSKLWVGVYEDAANGIIPHCKNTGLRASKPKQLLNGKIQLLFRKEKPTFIMELPGLNLKIWLEIHQW